MIARTKTNYDGTKNTTYFFYFGLTRALAEETTPEGRTRVRYLVNSTGETLAQERYEVTGVNQVDDADPGTWTWLLKDAHGNVATHVRNDGTVTKQSSYDPYGATDQGGTTGTSKSALGFQSAYTDDATGNILLGARIYDPKIDRFTTADFFVGSGSDLSLATDPLTGNRYLFAAANPVAFYDDGHEPCYVKNCNASYSGTKSQRGATGVNAAESSSPSMSYWGAVTAGESDPAALLATLHTALETGLPTSPRRSLGPVASATAFERFILRAIALGQRYRDLRISKWAGRGLGGWAFGEDVSEFLQDNPAPGAVGRAAGRAVGGGLAIKGMRLLCSGSVMCAAVTTGVSLLATEGGGELIDRFLLDPPITEVPDYTHTYVGGSDEACGPPFYPVAGSCP